MDKCHEIHVITGPLLWLRSTPDACGIHIYVHNMSKIVSCLGIYGRIVNYLLLFFSEILLLSMLSEFTSFACTVCQEVTYKWNNGMSHLGKKIKPHRKAAALVWNYSISIAFSISAFITGA